MSEREINNRANRIVDQLKSKVFPVFQSAMLDNGVAESPAGFPGSTRYCSYSGIVPLLQHSAGLFIEMGPTTHYPRSLKKPDYQSEMI